MRAAFFLLVRACVDWWAKVRLAGFVLCVRDAGESPSWRYLLIRGPLCWAGERACVLSLDGSLTVARIRLPQFLTCGHCGPISKLGANTTSHHTKNSRACSRTPLCGVLLCLVAYGGALLVRWARSPLGVDWAVWARFWVCEPPVLEPFVAREKRHLWCPRHLHKLRPQRWGGASSPL